MHLFLIEYILSTNLGSFNVEWFCAPSTHKNCLNPLQYSSKLSLNSNSSTAQDRYVL